MDSSTRLFFCAQRESSPHNRRCFESGLEGDDCTWASVSHGIYLSIGASGVHRSLGVKVSFVQSTTLDSWKPLHLKMMEIGGNRRFAEFLEAQGVPLELPIRDKYRTRAAQYYRELLAAEAEGRPPPEPLPQGTGHLALSSGHCRESEESEELNKVFATIPRRESMTAGGIQRQRSPLSRPRSERSWEHHGRAWEKELSWIPLFSSPSPSLFSASPPSLPSWVLDSFDQMTSSSSGLRTEKKLRSMSSGRMCGFGSECAPAEGTQCH